MPQQTNLNVAPYFDDFDPANDYHRVLFKPGYPVQARELTSLQSILQNQIEKFGQHFFKEGEKVIPGNTGYSQLYYCIQLENIYQGVPVSAYADQLVGTKITGLTSGVTAYVDYILLPEDSERNTLTLYINYLGSSTANNSTQVFSDGEELSCSDIITSGLIGNASIEVGSPFAITIANEAAATGSSFQIENGVYFVRGHFVNVNRETLILDQYTSRPNYRVGLFINEEIINADLDEDLNDNSQGYNNYAAPGADRLKLSVSLFKKALNDFDDTNFVELATVTDGNIRTKVRRGDLGGGPGYNNIEDTLARRTFAESGDYYVKPFDISVVDSLNDNLGNRGLYRENQLTSNGETPSDDLGVYRISPGRAFVRGYEVETLQPTFIDVEKPRTTRLIENESVIYNTGSSLNVNRVYRTPTIGLGNTYYVSLRDSRVGSSQEVAPGNEIGLARVYDFKLESGTYSDSNADDNEWGLSLFDVQTYTNLTLNSSVTLTVPTHIKGANSGATAFLKDPVTAGVALTVYEKSGNFIENESLIFDGINDGRIAIAVTEHGISKVKSIFGTTDGTIGINTFSADVIQSTAFNVGIATVSPGLTNGQSTVRSANPLFPGNIVIGDVISYTDIASSDDPIFAKVESVATNSITISGVTTVSGVADGKLPGSALNVTDFKILKTNLEESTDNTLYTRLPKGNVSDVDLTNASLTIRKSFTVNIVNNQITTGTLPRAADGEVFLPFTPARYSLVRFDGSTEELTADKFDFGSGDFCQVRNLGSDDTGATLVATLSKRNIKAKVKNKNKTNAIIIDKSKYSGSGTGDTTLNDGLTYGNFAFGTRVQDETISLNVPDAIEIHGIFESADTNNPSAPKLTLEALNTPSTTTVDLTLGEILVGETSGATAIYVERNSDTVISVVYKNDIKFKEGERISFKESTSTGTITRVDANSFEISGSYTFDTGQESTIYNYASITRRPEASEPTKKLKVYFTSASYDSTDDGDITTVNSYKNFNYSREIMAVEGILNADIIDIRPRVSNYTVSADQRSPLEFLGRSFNQNGNSSPNILASDENLLVNFSYYLGRIDRIFLNKEGKFQVKYGTPSENPEVPVPVDEALEIATVVFPPYLYNNEDADISFLEHKRYRMVDIKDLENRIKNLEYYTSLSLLEANTVNLFVPDQDGLNRFKSGFFVDNFNDFRPQDSEIPINNSIDRKRKEIRPRHYTNSIDLIPGPVTGLDPNEDLEFSTIEGVNVRRDSGVITLDYNEVEWLKQTFATRTESVTPFLISFWNGTLELTPATDTWVDTTRLEAKIIQAEGNYSTTLADAARTLNVDPQTGFSPVVWNAWNTQWTGTTVRNSTRTLRSSSSHTFGRGGWINGGSGGPAARIRRTTTTTTTQTLQQTTQHGVSRRDGIRTIIHEEFERQSVGDRVVNREVVAIMRSRNVQFVSKKVKPLTRLYTFFDGYNVTKYCIPKLLEISMTNGVFEVGETVIGRVEKTGLDQDNTTTTPEIRFRVAQSNHREGPYNSPTVTYPENPYTGTTLPTDYSSTSNILNVDTFSLSNEVQGSYYGWAEEGMVLVGASSGATATITNYRLVSDLSATLIGSFYIPDPNNPNHPKFETGTKTFTLTNDEDNDVDNATTIAEETFTSSGTIETVQENIISLRNARIERRREFQERNVNRDLGTRVTSSRSTSSSRESVIGWYDPLAQSFLVEDDTGVFITKCDVFFQSKDDMDIPVVFQIRTMENGFPTPNVLPFSEIVLDPSDVNISADGSVATTFEFKAPVYLAGGNSEYAIALASNSTKYSVYISRIGENDILSDTFISNQPYLGSLFKSQNASTWEPSQWEDLKFTLYRADFVESGSVEFYNPELSEGNGQIPTLMPQSLNFQSRQIRVGLGTTLGDTGYANGNTFTQTGTNATGNLVGTAGSVTGTLSITNTGIGYTPSVGGVTFNGVNLVTLTGKGRGATANVTISSGVAAAATISNGGSGYQVGDVLGISTIGISSVGRDARLSVVAIGQTSELILDNVQGQWIVGSANTIFYTNSSGISTELNYDNGGDIQVSTINVDRDGLHVKVDHQNHGMYFDDNLVRITGAETDVKPTKLTGTLSLGDTTPITLEDATAFSQFEGVGVGTTNVGYALIGDEIIEYTNVSGNNLGGNIVRGSNQRGVYPVGTPVYKYELNGINLHRINKVHDLSDSTATNPITYDSYTIKLDTSELINSNNDDRSDNVGFHQLYPTTTKSTGGYKIRASQNMPFEIATPQIQTLTVSGTNVTAEMRTLTSQSMSGTEIPYVDAGYEPVTINESNYFETPRMVASKINEDAKLTNIPGAKSLNLRMSLTTTDTRVSPVIDSQRVSAILTSNRVNNPISDYVTDPRVNTLTEDPHAFQYISKEINLENPASSLKILVNAHINLDNDIRAFYAISDKVGFNPIFEPFPGFDNLDRRGRVINSALNSGRSDKSVPKANFKSFEGEQLQYNEFTFSVDDLPAFRSYKIKIVMSSTNQVYVPRMKDLRVIALA